MSNAVIYTEGMTLAEVEKMIILKSLAYTRSKTTTAASLGIAIRTLDNKLAKYKEDDVADEQRRADRDKRNDELLRAARGLPSLQEGPDKQEIERAVPASQGDNGGESTEVIGKKSVVSLSERQETKDMLPRQTTSFGSSKAR